MKDTRHKNVDWQINANSNNTVNWEGVTAAILMDIRDELQTLNRLLGCHNFTRIHRVLDAIRLNTRKPKRPTPAKRRSRRSR